ncbi:MAG: FeoB-associated Cys-rich membrane protein [Thermodesulfobacteriota bacterium]
MEIILVIIAVGVAVWYLYRNFARSLKAGNPSCGCGGCTGCPAENPRPKPTETPHEFGTSGKPKDEHGDAK